MQRGAGHLLEERRSSRGHRPAGRQHRRRALPGKITLSTGELFAWTFVIILLSAVFEKLFLALLDKAVAAVLGEEGMKNE